MREENEALQGSGRLSETQSQSQYGRDSFRGLKLSKQSPVASVGSGEAHAAASAGSPGTQGTLEHVVSLDRGGGASGFIGKMSEISWIQRAFDTVRGSGMANLTDARVGSVDELGAVTTDYSYFMDDTDVLTVDEDFVDQYYWPPAKTIVLLSEAFFHAMQGATCFVSREEFLHDVFQFALSDRQISWYQLPRMALANLTWAIAAKWLQMAKLNEPNSIDDHVTYYARARALGLDHRVMFDHPDIERIQGIGLISFYLLINGSITR
jgi:hypothetical protein